MRLAALLILLHAAPAAAAEAGTPFFYWGYNRALYARSDIHFTGPGYDMTLQSVRAQDRPSDFDAGTYLRPKTLTVPQYNFRLGYFMKSWLSVSLGMDHMKYVVVTDQRTRLSGYVDPEASATYQGLHQREDVGLGKSFVALEHTDGLNYVSLDADVSRTFLQRHWLQVDGMAGLGFGAVIPRSDVRVFGQGKNNVFHVAGYGVSGQVGADVVFASRAFVRGAVKVGFMDLADILTTGSDADRAEQRFTFGEAYAVLGWRL